MSNSSEWGANQLFSMGISARIVKRIITLLIVTLGVVTLSFCLQIFTGTDPAEMLVRKTTLFATEEQIQAMRVELGWMVHSLSNMQII